MSASMHSLISLLAYHAQLRPKAIALRHKKLGRWEQWTWHELLKRSEKYASALDKLGLKKDQVFLICSSPNVDIVAISLAIQALGGKVQLFDQSFENSIKHDFVKYLAALKPDYILVEQLEWLVSIESLNCDPAYIFYLEQNNLKQIQHEHIVDLTSLLAENKTPLIDFNSINIPASQIAFSFEHFENNQRFSIDYSHQDLIQEAELLVQTHELNEDEEAFIARAFSSIGHIRYLWSAWLLAGFSLNIPETLQTRDQDRQVIAPTLVLGTKSTYERVEQLIIQRLPQSGSWLRKAYYTVLLQAQQQLPLSLLQKILLGLFKRAILEELGFSRLKTALIVGEGLDEITQHFYENLGVKVVYWGQQAEWNITQFADFNHETTVISVSVVQ